MKEYNKLVRDKILKILKIKGKGFKYHIADDSEYKEKLWEKLQEEIQEFKENPSVEEMADILEVITAISKSHKINWKKLIEKRYEKRIERGAFDNKIILEKADE